MKYFVILALTLPSIALAKMKDLKPGKWRVAMSVTQNGKKSDPFAQMKEAMAKMPPEQRKQMEEMVKKQMGAMTDKGTEVCYSKKTFEEGALTKQKKDCTTKVAQDTATTFEATFTCKDGSKGDSKFTIKDGTHVKGQVNMTTAKGEKTTVENEMTFLSADCGTLKPIEG